MMLIEIEHKEITIRTIFTINDGGWRRKVKLNIYSRYNKVWLKILNKKKLNKIYAVSLNVIKNSNNNQSQLNQSCIHTFRRKHSAAIEKKQIDKYQLHQQR